MEKNTKDKTVEYKAREALAKHYEKCRNMTLDEEIDNCDINLMGLFIAGHQSRDEEAKQLREALTELVEDAEKLLKKPIKISNLDSFRGNSIVKAKQLLKVVTNNPSHKHEPK